MLELPPAHWPRLLRRLAERYAAQLITVRQQGPSEGGGELLLWRVPLRALWPSAAAPGATLHLQAGHEYPFLTIAFADVAALHLALDEADELRALLITADDGTVTTVARSAE